MTIRKVSGATSSIVTKAQLVVGTPGITKAVVSRNQLLATVSTDVDIIKAGLRRPELINTLVYDDEGSSRFLRDFIYLGVDRTKFLTGKSFSEILTLVDLLSIATLSIGRNITDTVSIGQPEPDFIFGKSIADGTAIADPAVFSFSKLLADSVGMLSLANVDDGNIFDFVLRRQDQAFATELLALSAQYLRTVEHDIAIADTRYFNVGIGRFDDMTLSDILFLVRLISPTDDFNVAESRVFAISKLLADSTTMLDLTGVFDGSTFNFGYATSDIVDVTDPLVRLIVNTARAVNDTINILDAITSYSGKLLFEEQGIDEQHNLYVGKSAESATINLPDAPVLIASLNKYETQILDDADIISVGKAFSNVQSVLETRSFYVEKPTESAALTLPDVATLNTGLRKTDTQILDDAGIAKFLFKDILMDPEMLEKAEFVVIKVSDPEIQEVTELFVRRFDAVRGERDGFIENFSTISAPTLSPDLGKFEATFYDDAFSRIFVSYRRTEEDVPAQDQIFKFEQRLPFHAIAAYDNKLLFRMDKTFGDTVGMVDLAGIYDGNIFALVLNKAEDLPAYEYYARRIRFRRRARDGFIDNQPIAQHVGLFASKYLVDDVTIVQADDSIAIVPIARFNLDVYTDDYFYRQVDFYRNPWHNDAAPEGSDGFDNIQPISDDNANSPGPAKDFTTFIPSPTKSDTTSVMVKVGGVSSTTTNLLFYSEDLTQGSYWNYAVGIVSSSNVAVTDPLGNTSNVTMISASGSGVSEAYIGQEVSTGVTVRTPTIPGKQYYFSVWAKVVTGTATLRLAADQNLSTLGFNQVTSAYTITTSWQQLRLAVTSSVRGTRVFIGTTSSSPNWGDGAPDLMLWGAHLSEQLSHSYVKTTTEQYTGANADQRNTPGELSQWWIDIDAKASTSYSVVNKTVDYVIPNSTRKIVNPVAHNSSVTVSYAPKDRDSIGVFDYAVYNYYAGRVVTDQILLGSGDDNRYIYNTERTWFFVRRFLKEEDGTNTRVTMGLPFGIRVSDSLQEQAKFDIKMRMRRGVTTTTSGFTDHLATNVDPTYVGSRVPFSTVKLAGDTNETIGLFLFKDRSGDFVTANTSRFQLMPMLRLGNDSASRSSSTVTLGSGFDQRQADLENIKYTLLRVNKQGVNTVVQGWGTSITTTAAQGERVVIGDPTAVTPTSTSQSRRSGASLENVSHIFLKDAKRSVAGTVLLNTIDPSPDLENRNTSSVAFSVGAADTDIVGTVDAFNNFYMAGRVVTDILYAGRYDDPGYNLYGDNPEKVKFFFIKRPSDATPMLDLTDVFDGLNSTIIIQKQEAVTFGRGHTSTTFPERRSGTDLEKAAFFVYKEAKQAINRSFSGNTVTAADLERIYVGSQDNYGFRVSGEYLENTKFFYSKLADQDTPTAVVLGRGTTSEDFPERRSGDSLDNPAFRVWVDAKASVRSTVQGWSSSFTTQARDRDRVVIGDPSAVTPVTSSVGIQSRRSGTGLENISYWMNLDAKRSVAGTVLLNTIDPNPDLENRDTSSVTFTVGALDRDIVGTVDAFNNFYMAGRVITDLLIAGGDQIDGAGRVSGTTLENISYWFNKRAYLDDMTTSRVVMGTAPSEQTSNSLNYLIYSEDLSYTSSPNGWARTFGVAATPQDMTYADPAGGFKATKLVAIYANSYIGQELTTSSGFYTNIAIAGKPHTFSIWLRADTGTSLAVNLSVDTNASTIAFNSVTSCTVTETWQRFFVNFTPSATVSVPRVFVGGGSTFTTGETVYAWGAQVTPVFGLRPYVATTSNPVLVPAIQERFSGDELENVSYWFDKNSQETTVLGRGTTSVIYPERRSGTDLERASFIVLKEAKQSINRDVSGTTVTAYDQDRLFVGQQYGDIRFSGDLLENVKFFNRKLADQDAPQIVYVGRENSSQDYPERRSGDNLDNPAFFVRIDAKQTVSNTLVGFGTSITVAARDRDRVFIGDPTAFPATSSIQTRRSGTTLENVSYWFDKVAKRGSTTALITQTIDGNNGYVSSVSLTQSTADTDAVGTLNFRRHVANFVRYPWYNTYDDVPGAFDNGITIGDDSTYSPFPAKQLNKRILQLTYGTNLITTSEAIGLAVLGFGDWQYASVYGLSLTDVTETVPPPNNYPLATYGEVTQASGDWIRYPQAVSPNTQYTWSWYVQVTDDRLISFGGITPLYYKVLGVGTNTSTLVASTLYSSGFTPYTWNRVSVTFTTGADDTLVWLYPYGNEVEGDYQGWEAYYWGWQLNQGDAADGYVSTTGVARTAATGTANVVVVGTQTPVVYGNLVDNSEDFTSTRWRIATTSSITVSSNVALAPNGTLTATQLTANYANSYIYQYTLGGTIGAVSSSQYTYSVWLKHPTSSVALRLYIDGDGAGTNPTVLTSITVTNSWQRYQLTASSSIVTTSNPTVYIGGGSTFTTGETVYAWGAQLNPGADVTPYVQTTATPIIYTTQSRYSGDELENVGIFFDKNAKRGATGTLLLNTIDPSPDVEYQQSSVAITRTAWDLDEVGTLDYFSMYYLLFRQFDDSILIGSGLDQARGNDLDKMRFLITKLLGDVTEMVSLAGIYDGNIFQFTLNKRDSFSFGSGPANQTFPARTKGGDLENLALEFDLTAKQSINRAVSGTTVTAADGDRLFVGQQWGNIRQSGDLLENIKFFGYKLADQDAPAIVTLGSGIDQRQSEVENIKYTMLKRAYVDDGAASTSNVVMGTGLQAYNSSNLLTYSEELTTSNGAWALTNGLINIVTNDTTYANPFGGTSGVTKLRPTTTNRWIGQEISSTLIVGQTYNFSLWARTTGSTIAAGLYADTNGGLQLYSFDTGTAFSATGAWTRFSTNFVAGTSTSIRVFIGNASVWDTNEELFVYGAQVTPSTTSLTYYATTSTAGGTWSADRYSGDPVENVSYWFDKKAQRGTSGATILNTIDLAPDASNWVSSVSVSRTAQDLDDVGTIDVFALDVEANRIFEESILIGSGLDARKTLLENTVFFTSKALGPLLDTQTIVQLGSGQDIARGYGAELENTAFFIRKFPGQRGVDDTSVAWIGRGIATSQTFPERRSGTDLERASFDISKIAQHTALGSSLGNFKTNSGNLIRVTDSLDPVFVGSQGLPLGWATLIETTSKGTTARITYTGYNFVSGNTYNFSIFARQPEPMATSSVSFTLYDPTNFVPTTYTTSVTGMNWVRLSYAWKATGSSVSWQIATTAALIVAGAQAVSSQTAITYVKTTGSRVANNFIEYSEDFTQPGYWISSAATLLQQAVPFDLAGEVPDWARPGDYWEKVTFDVAKLADQSDPAFVTIGRQDGDPGYNLYGSEPERVKFLVSQPKQDLVPVGTANQGSMSSWLNLVKYSEELTTSNGAWALTNGSINIVTNDTTYANPNGVTSGVTKLRPTTTNRYIGQTLTNIVSGESYTFSFWVRSTGSTIGAGAYIDVNGGATSFDGGGTFNAIGTWIRVAYPFTALTSEGIRVFIGNASVWDTNEELFIWGAQVNPGSSATTYVPTTIAPIGIANYQDRFSEDPLENVGFWFGKDAKRSVDGLVELKFIDPADGNGGANSSVSIVQTAADYDWVGSVDYMSMVTLPVRTFREYLMIGSDYDQRNTDLENIAFRIGKKADQDTPAFVVLGSGEDLPRTNDLEFLTFNAYLRRGSFNSDSEYVTVGQTPVWAENIVQYSEQFQLNTSQIVGHSTYWATSNLTVTSTSIRNAPNGTATADTLLDNTVNNQHVITQQMSSSIMATSSIYTFSVYASAGSSFTNRLFHMRTYQTNPTALSCITNFELSGDGRVQETPTPHWDQGIQRIDANWYRCWVSFTTTSQFTTAQAVAVRLGMVAVGPDANDPTNYSSSYTGNTVSGGGTSTVLVWGAQLNRGSIPLNYIQTTTAPILYSTSPDRRSGNDAEMLAIEFDLDAKQGIVKTVSGTTVTARDGDRLFVGQQWGTIRQSGDLLENIKFTVRAQADQSDPAFVLAGRQDGDPGYRLYGSEAETTKFYFHKYPGQRGVDDTSVAFIGRANSSQTFPERRSDDQLDNPAFFFSKTAKRSVAGTVLLNTIDPNPDVEYQQSSVAVTQTSMDLDRVGTLDRFNLFYAVGRIFEDSITIGSGDDARYLPAERTFFFVRKRLGQDDGSEILDLADIYDGLNYNSYITKRDSVTLGRGLTSATFPERRSGDQLDNPDFFFSLDAKQGVVKTVSGTTVTARDGDRLFVGQRWGTVRQSADPMERLVFRVGKQADQDLPQTVTLGSGFDQRQDNFENIKYLMFLRARDDNTGVNTHRVYAGRETTSQTFPERRSGDSLDNPAYFFTKLAKQGVNNTVSGTTVTAANGDRLFVGQRWGNTRLSGDRQEKILFEFDKDLGNVDPLNITPVDVYRRTTRTFRKNEELATILGEREGNVGLSLAQGTKYDDLTASDSVVPSTLLFREYADLSGDLDPFGNINTVASNGNLRMTDYVDLDYFIDDYVGEARTFT